MGTYVIIPPDAHKQFKIIAASKGKKLNEYMEELAIQEYEKEFGKDAFTRI